MIGKTRMINYLSDFRGKILARKVEKTNYLSSSSTSTTIRTPCTKDELKHLKKCKLQVCDECKRILKREVKQ